MGPFRGSWARALGVAACAASMGCQGEEEQVEPAPYLAGEVDAPEVDVDVDGLSDTIRAAVDLALAVDPGPVFDVYRAVTAARDGYCPYFAGDDATANWYGECSAATGAAFSGYGGHETRASEVEWVETAYLTGAVVSADGARFEGGGYVYRGGGADGAGGEIGYAGIQGSFRWDGPGAEGTWLQDGDDWSIEKYWSRAEWGRAVALSGGLSVDGELVALEIVSVDTVCPQEPQGVVSVRGADGWVDVVFDLDLERGTDPRLCDGCGTAYYRGRLAGKVCVDLFDVATFEEAPW